MKDFDARDAYMLSGIWLLCFDHPIGGVFCIVVSLLGTIAVRESKKGVTK